MPPPATFRNLADHTVRPLSALGPRAAELIAAALSALLQALCALSTTVARVNSIGDQEKKRVALPHGFWPRHRGPESPSSHPSHSGNPL